jgi:hypothetical protein
LDGAVVIATAIITAPREKPTLLKSLASFKAAGFVRANIHAEPGCEHVIDNGIEWRQNEMRKGNFKNWVAALQGLMAYTDCDWLMVCEDDISWTYDAATILEYDLNRWQGDNRTGAISLYCPIRISKVLEKQHGGRLHNGWYEMNLGRSNWGAQCMVLHRTWAMQLLNDKVLAAYIKDPRWDKNVDAIIADTIGRRGRTIMYRIPCLVDHTFGDGNSSLGYKPDRPMLKTNYFKDVQ